MSEYEAKAQNFLDKHGLKIKTAWKGSDAPAWAKDTVHGDKYRVSIKRQRQSVSFDFWGSYHDKQNGIAPTPYSILACVSGDINGPENFSEFCSVYGYDEDSRADYQLFLRASKLARKLRAFFYADEIEDLADIS